MGEGGCSRHSVAELELGMRLGDFIWRRRGEGLKISYLLPWQEVPLSVF